MTVEHGPVRASEYVQPRIYCKGFIIASSFAARVTNLFYLHTKNILFNCLYLMHQTISKQPDASHSRDRAIVFRMFCNSSWTELTASRAMPKPA